MAEAAICSAPRPLHFTGEMRGKRKTPSELRSEQLKRLQNNQNQTSCLLESQIAHKQDASKVPRFVDTRVPDIYPVTKQGDRPGRLATDKKEVSCISQKYAEHSIPDTAVVTIPDRAKSLAKFQWKGSEENSQGGSDTRAKHSVLETSTQSSNQQSGSTPFSTFRNVTQLSTGAKPNNSWPSVDMAKALKGMSVSRTTSLVEQISGFFPLAEGLPLSENRADSMKLSPSVIQSNKLPLDLSLKTSVRFTSDASFERCERITNQDLYVGMKNFLIMSRGQEPCTAQNNMEVANMSQNKVEVSFAEALHSWIYPQSVLPSSVLSALASAAAHGSSSEKEFLSKRQLTWEDSFRSLYYIFRNGQCDLFYFSTQQFLAMFISGGILKKNKNEISAYISRSTRGLRALFQEQDISFSMPLCVTKVDTSVEEIQELTEFEKSHPGQTRLVDSMAAVDNSPQSLLVFSGQKSVHGLYDFLLNHRSLLSSTTGADVPVLYSPTPFQNASLVMPEVVCKKLHTPGDGITNEHSKQYTMNARHSLEVRGGVLPPWVVWRVCRVVQQLQHGKWEASFASDPLTGGFNIAQMYGVTEGQEEETVKGSFLREELNDSVILSPEMRTGFVKELKMDEGSYAVTLSVV